MEGERRGSSGSGTGPVEPNADEERKNSNASASSSSSSEDEKSTEKTSPKKTADGKRADDDVVDSSTRSVRSTPEPVAIENAEVGGQHQAEEEHEPNVETEPKTPVGTQETKEDEAVVTVNSPALSIVREDPQAHTPLTLTVSGPDEVNARVLLTVDQPRSTSALRNTPIPAPMEEIHVHVNGGPTPKTPLSIGNILVCTFHRL
jgi:hypothetical protein